MRVVAKIACGFGRNGAVLLRKGLNDLPEPLIATERAFIEAMHKAKLVEIVSEQVPDAPVSETKLIASEPEPALPRGNATPVPKKATLRKRGRAAS